MEAETWALELSDYVHLNPGSGNWCPWGLGKHRRAVEAEGIGPPPTREEVSARLRC